MAMPNRKTVGGELYRYGYQGEFAETDPETGKPAFQLRLYDPRINRWLTTDPYGQYHSPYMAMDNRPNMSVDPDGGCTDPPCDVDGGMLPEVVINVPSGGGFPNFSSISDMYSNLGTWQSDYTSLADWNKDFGQNFNNRYDAYSYYQQNQQQQRTNDFVSSIHAAQREGGMFLLTTLSILSPWAFAFGSASGAVNIARSGTQRVVFSYADDAISYSVKIHRAPTLNLATGQITSQSSKVLNFGKGALNTTHLSSPALNTALRPWPANAANASPFVKYLFPKLAIPVVYDRYQRHINK
ncbi:MAG: hypothetical protein L3J08_06705 [Flavobacteriaceae bacterium]|nr:hypothetical protein [Flavobacteriaceae bacterium]